MDWYRELTRHQFPALKGRAKVNRRFATDKHHTVTPLLILPMTKAPNQIASSETSIKRGLDFIYRIANTPEGFDSYGSLLICCFALVGATSRDASLRQLADHGRKNSPNAGAACIRLFRPMPPRIWSSILSWSVTR